MTGYSGTPLARKLGIKPGYRLRLGGAPPDYHRKVGKLPPDVMVSSGGTGAVELWHLFVRSRADLLRKLPVCRRQITPAGMIWVSWPKKSSGVASDLTEDAIRAAAFPLQLVDVKVCAVDQTWSGLKLVIRREHRSL